MTHPSSSGIVGTLYDIALNPKSLDEFINTWTEAGLDAGTVRAMAADIDQFDAAYQDHLNRAESFLHREISAEYQPDILAPFQSLAAFIVSEDRKVAACNDRAEQMFEIAQGDPMSAAIMPAVGRETLDFAVARAFNGNAEQRHFVRDGGGQTDRPTIYQTRRITMPGKVDTPHVLVVTTNALWNDALGATLAEVFDLTQTEQAIAKALVEGKNTKEIAQARDTTEGTARIQIKSILRKMNARNQSEIIRLILSLRELSEDSRSQLDISPGAQPVDGQDWLDTEVWKPFREITLPDGRRMFYHDMGPIDGAPILFSHMGYCQARWHRPMLAMAFKMGLRIIVPIRAGYGHSDDIDPKGDIIAAARGDTLHLLDHLGIHRLPYVPQGNDLIFAADLAANHPERVSEIIGLCARPYLDGDLHYAGMSKWHRFFLSTAKHAPHLLSFTAKAAMAMARRIGVVAMFQHMQKDSPPDMALYDNKPLVAVMTANAELVAGKTTLAAQAYTMELLASEAPWDHLLIQAKDIPIRFINAAQDPAIDVATVAQFRDKYPWIDIEVIPDAGQMLIYQKFRDVIPILAEAAKAAHPRRKKKT